MDVWARPSREGVGNGEPWIKARVTPVLVIEMSRKSLGGWRAKYSRGWQKDVSAQGDGEPHVLGTEVATFWREFMIRIWTWAWRFRLIDKNRGFLNGL